jgi:uncharacterized protein YbaR (Trm112 family)
MLACPECNHRICYDELQNVLVADWSSQVLLGFQCSACGCRSAFVVSRTSVEQALRVNEQRQVHLIPGCLVNECRAEEMMGFEKMGPITADELIEFSQGLMGVN